VADSELADLTAATTLASTDLLYAVVDPAGTPLDRKVTIATLQAELNGLVGMFFGDGSDGDVTVTGGTTTLTRDMFYDDLTISSTGILAVAGFRVFVRGLLTIEASGVLHADGANAIANAGGGFGVQGTVDRGGVGASGVSGAAGANGTSVSTSLGGAGGNGGAGASGAGGTGGTATAPAAAVGPPRFPSVFGWARNSTSVLAYTGGGGGASGGGDATPTHGGGGGSGGNILVVVARTISNSGTIRANGGAGAARGFGTNPGGGGGGGGGAVIIVSTSTSVGGTVTAAGGTFGAGAGTGVNGVAGSAGTVITILGAAT
jgi:hypothetical protein